MNFYVYKFSKYNGKLTQMLITFSDIEMKFLVNLLTKEENIVEPVSGDKLYELI